MKKIVYSIIMAMIFSLFSIIPCFAAETPVFDSNYNGSKGALYANGTDIVIDKDANNNTVVSWNGGSQIVPETVSIFGGGNGNKAYDTSNIIMNNGTVYNVIGGGINTDLNSSSNVNKSNIVVNGGKISNNLVGGGYLYSKVNEAYIEVNGGEISNIVGGGFASVVIDGISYSSGVQGDEINSGTRVEKVNIIINNGKINTSVFGGGQGYSYTGDTEIIINNGNLENAHVTIGGSNGYTRDGILRIEGGKINVVQSVNRGIVETAKYEMTGGEVNEFYIGGESTDPGVTGIVRNVTTELLDGKITNLNAGVSNLIPLEIDNVFYKVIKLSDIEVLNNRIGEGIVEVNYDFSIFPNEITMNEGESRRIYTNLTTTPPGYEYLLEDDIVFSSDNENIASVDNRGIVTGRNDGTAIITAQLDSKMDTSIITVEDSILGRIIIIYFIITLILFVIVFIIIHYIFDTIERKCRKCKKHYCKDEYDNNYGDCD